MSSLLSLLAKQFAGEFELKKPDRRFVRSVRLKDDDAPRSGAIGAVTPLGKRIMGVLEGVMTPAEVAQILGIRTETARKYLESLSDIGTVERIKIPWKEANGREYQRHAYQKVQQQEEEA